MRVFFMCFDLSIFIDKVGTQRHMQIIKERPSKHCCEIRLQNRISGSVGEASGYCRLEMLQVIGRKYRYTEII